MYFASDVDYICHPRYNGWIFSATTQINYSVSYRLCVKQDVGLAGRICRDAQQNKVEYSARYRMTDRASPGQGEVRPLVCFLFS